MSNQHKKDVGAVWHKSGVTFRVWAPFATSVGVAGTFNGWAKSELASEGDGYWSTKIKGAEAGQEYKFVINSGGGDYMKNDPRALEVITSSGNSVIVQPGFDWSTGDFTPPPQNQCVFYELHIGTFNRPDPSAPGTFASAIDKLDYIAGLGINMIELMPVHTMLMDRGWGYAPDFINAVESLYGGRHEFMRFVDEAHKRGIGVVLDVVYNHFGPDDKLDLWRFDGWYERKGGGIYFYNDWRAETPWGATRPDFGRQEVRQYMLDNARMWLRDFRLDGLRVDSTIFIRNVRGNNNDPSNDLPDGWGFLQNLTNAVRKLKPGALIIGEDVGANDYLTKGVSIGGAGFASQWDVGFPHAIRDVLLSIEDRYRNLNGLCAALEHYFNGNAFERVIYSDSHDSAANGGKRLAEEITPGEPTSMYARRRSLQAAALTLTCPGMPMIFQGTEFMTGGSFNDWEALDWKNTEKFGGIVEVNKHLIALRKNSYGHSAGLSGSSINIIHMNEEAKILAYHRWDRGGQGDDVMVVFNFSNQALHGYSMGFPRDGFWKVRFNSDWKGYSPDFTDVSSGDVTAKGNNASINIGPYSVLIFSQDP